MTERLPVSIIYNRWQDAQQVDQTDMEVEQDRNIQIDAATIQNHFGTGVLLDSLVPNVIFDTDNLTADQAALVVSNDFDGTGVQAANQPTDSVLGNQLEVELTGSDAFGRLSVKVLIIGLDFQGIPQFDRFYFYRNEKQVTKNHYTRILGIFFNDFKGNNNCSRFLGGRVVIQEASSYQLSRDPIMVAQDLEPDLFFRDFKISGLNATGNPTVTLFQTLQAGIGPEFSVDALNINTNVKVNQNLSPGDVSSRVGQKFLATTNNIQKVTLLLGVQADEAASIQNRFDWSGSLVISIHELQTTVSCPTDLVPELQIEFDPNPVPLAQISITQQTLRDLGYVLTDVLQPVDFVFSGTQLGSATNSVIVPGRYYAVVINRAGAANTGTVFTGVGNSRIENSRLTLFSNNVWVDVVEDDLWFQVWTDAAKVADGQAYDSGNGIQIEKTEVNNQGATVDFALDAQNFVDSGENTLNIGIVDAVEVGSQEEQDQRTGSPVLARQQFEPQFSFVTESTLQTLQETSEPLIIGCAQDINPVQNPLIEGITELPGLVKGDIFTVVAPEPDLLSLNLIGSKLIPNSDCNTFQYRIFRVLLCTDGYGDVNGDGYIDGYDVSRASQLIGESVFSPSTQQKIVDGYISTLELLRADVDGDGYITSNDVTLISEFVSRQINAFPVGATFQRLELQVQQDIGRFDGYFDCDGYVRLDGYTGQNIIDPSTLSPIELEYFGFIQTPDMDGYDPIFNQIPFMPVPYQIQPQPFWQDYLLLFSSEARVVPAAFSFPENTLATNCANEPNLICENFLDRELNCEPGRNDILLPDNLIMRRGQILNPDGSHYKIDFEVAHIILELPAEPLDEAVIDVFRKFIVDAGTGMTSAGYPALRFSDCTTVQADALARNQIRFGVSIQAFNPNLDGYTDFDGYGIIADDIIGVFFDATNGLLTLTIRDLNVDPIFMTLVTKIQISVYLKKSGFNNQPLIIPSTQIIGLLS